MPEETQGPGQQTPMQFRASAPVIDSCLIEHRMVDLPGAAQDSATTRKYGVLSIVPAGRDSGLRQHQ
jgi:hypothetical protein